MPWGGRRRRAQACLDLLRPAHVDLPKSAILIGSIAFTSREARGVHQKFLLVRTTQQSKEQVKLVQFWGWSGARFQLVCILKSLTLVWFFAETSLPTNMPDKKTSYRIATILTIVSDWSENCTHLWVRVRVRVIIIITVYGVKPVNLYRGD